MKQIKSITKEEIEAGYINAELRNYEDSINSINDLNNDEIDCLLDILSE